MMTTSAIKRFALSTSAIVAMSLPAASAYAQVHRVQAPQYQFAAPFVPPASATLNSSNQSCDPGVWDGCAPQLRGRFPAYSAVPPPMPRQMAPPPMPRPAYHPPLRPRSNAEIVTKTAQNLSGDVLRPRQSPSPFKISVDGQTVAGHGFDYESRQQATDLGLARTDIQVKFDGLDVTPRLNIGVEHGDAYIARGQEATLHTYSNYWAFIQNAEVRLFTPGQSVEDRPIAVLPVIDGKARFVAGYTLPDEIVYQLRVYDGSGKFDETEPKSVRITDRPHMDPDNKHDPRASLAIYGKDNTRSRNIAVKGGSVTVSGEHVPAGHFPNVMGLAVPIDGNGKFVTQEILPYGDHAVTVSVLNGAQQGVNFQRDIHIKDTDFFYVAIGDITLGQRQAVGPVDLTDVNDEDFDDVIINGRGAFYLKGKVKGDYLITAAMDTGEEQIKDIFSNLDEKDPRQLLRRLDADRYYPVYGDHSTIREDAPTQGKFYVRVEKDDSHIMWGNFATDISGTEFARLDRGLYGGIIDYNSEATNKFGDRVTELTAFAADPGTVPEVDEFRGTGGSVYFLRRQDVSIGSERVRVEIRDKVTGLTLESRVLIPYQDYDFDYIQGRILLTEPLQSTSSDNELVRTGGLSGHEVYLVIRYEHTPGLTAIDGYDIGGRATQWIGDHIRLGATAQRETTASADQELFGADVLLKASENTYVKAEYAQSEGPAFGQSDSTDGGFLFDDIASPGASGMISEAYRLETQLDLADLRAMYNQIDAKFKAIIEHQDEGFAGVGRIGDGEVDRIVLEAEAGIGDKIDISARYDDVESSRRGDHKAIYGDLRASLVDELSVGLGIRHDERDNSVLSTLPGAPIAQIQGKRTDASVQIEFEPGNDINLRGFAQATLDRDGTRARNNRAGVGADIQLNSRMALRGEISEGDGGLGVNTQLSYKRSEDSEVYFGYALDTDHPEQAFSGNGVNLAQNGVLTAGGRTKLNDALSIYGEERAGLGKDRRSLTHAYGVKFQPDDKWVFSASIENGVIEDEINGDFDRTAVAVSASRATDSLRIATNLEARLEDGELNGQTRDRRTYLVRNSVAYDAHENVQLLGKLNFAISESDQDSFLDSDFVEGVVGAAYRPVNNDRFNGLLKYTYFEDLSPAQQLSNLGQQNLARQRSHVFSVDGTYKLNKALSLGAKYGMRRGEVALDRASDQFVSSDAHLGIVRADLHVVKKWDVLLEGRMKKSDLADNVTYGALGGIYRHVGDNVKLGVGYSFSEYSDDLTDFSNDGQGFFLNAVGKF